ncbi:uncharacterized protein V6R79_025083 [Siganus canaliculatus]
MRRLRTSAGGGVDADRLLSAALCPPSVCNHTDTDREHRKRLGKAQGDRSAFDEGIFSSAFTGVTCFSV